MFCWSLLILFSGAATTLVAPLPFVVREYAVNLTLDPRAEDYTGTVMITVATDEIVSMLELDYAKNITPLKGKIELYPEGAEGKDLLEAKMIAVEIGNTEMKNGRLRLPLAQHIGQDRVAVISLEFKGKLIANGQAGHVRWPTSTKSDDWEIHTQFYPDLLSTAIPCFTREMSKAAFKLRLIVPSEYSAIATMPAVQDTVSSDGNTRDVRFECSERLAPFSIGWSVGRFGSVQGSGHRSIKINAQLRHINSCHRVLKVVKQLHQYYFGMFGKVDSRSEYIIAPFSRPVGYASGLTALSSHHFLLDYSIDDDDDGAKQDLELDSHSRMYQSAPSCFSSSSTKPASDITTLASSVQVSSGGQQHPRKASLQYESRMYWLLARQIAHKWFGSSVTPNVQHQFWSIGGFANWAACNAIDAINPQSVNWSWFYAGPVNSALAVHSHALHFSSVDMHAWNNPVIHTKMTVLFRMLEASLGKEVMHQALTTFFTRFNNSNAGLSELCKILDTKGQISVGTLHLYVDLWMKQSRFPLLEVEDSADLMDSNSSNSSHFKVTQKEFRKEWRFGEAMHEDVEPLFFPIPYNLFGELVSSGESTPTNQKLHWWKGTGGIIVRKHANYPLLFRGSPVYCRVKMPETFYLQLSAATFNSLLPVDQVSLLSDSAALCLSGHVSTASLLRVLSLAAQSSLLAVWLLLDKIFLQLYMIFQTKDATGLARFIKEHVGRHMDKIGYEESPGDTDNARRLRPILIRWMAILQDSQAVGFCVGKAKKWMGLHESTVLPAPGCTTMSRLMTMWVEPIIDALSPVPSQLDLALLPTECRGEILAVAMKNSLNPNPLLRLLMSREIVSEEERIAVFEGLGSSLHIAKILSKAWEMPSLFPILLKYPWNFPTVFDFVIANLHKFVEMTDNHYLINILHPIAMLIGTEEQYRTFKEALLGILPDQHGDQVSAVLSMAEDNLAWSRDNPTLDI